MTAHARRRAAHWLPAPASRGGQGHPFLVVANRFRADAVARFHGARLASGAVVVTGACVVALLASKPHRSAVGLRRIRRAQVAARTIGVRRATGLYALPHGLQTQANEARRAIRVFGAAARAVARAGRVDGAEAVRSSGTVCVRRAATCALRTSEVGSGHAARAGEHRAAVAPVAVAPLVAAVVPGDPGLRVLAAVLRGLRSNVFVSRAASNAENGEEERGTDPAP